MSCVLTPKTIKMKIEAWKKKLQKNAHLRCLSLSLSRILKVSVSEGVVSVSNGQVSVSDDEGSVSVSDSEAETPSLAYTYPTRGTISSCGPFFWIYYQFIPKCLPMATDCNLLFNIYAFRPVNFVYSTLHFLLGESTRKAFQTGPWKRDPRVCKQPPLSVSDSPIEYWPTHTFIKYFFLHSNDFFF